MATDDVPAEIRRALEGDPACKICGGDADFLLYRERRVTGVVCWEHVSPVAAEVDADPEETTRPVAIPVSDEFR